MHLRELVEILGPPTGWTDQQTLTGLDPYVILEWNQEESAVTCIMIQQTETAIALEHAGAGWSQRWIADAARDLLEPQLASAGRVESAVEVLKPWLG